MLPFFRSCHSSGLFIYVVRLFKSRIKLGGRSLLDLLILMLAFIILDLRGKLITLEVCFFRPPSRDRSTIWNCGWVINVILSSEAQYLRLGTHSMIATNRPKRLATHRTISPLQTSMQSLRTLGGGGLSCERRGWNDESSWIIPIRSVVSDLDPPDAPGVYINVGSCDINGSLENRTSIHKTHANRKRKHERKHKRKPYGCMWTQQESQE